MAQLASAMYLEVKKISNKTIPAIRVIFSLTITSAPTAELCSQTMKAWDSDLTETGMTVYIFFAFDADPPMQTPQIMFFIKFILNSECNPRQILK